MLLKVAEEIAAAINKLDNEEELFTMWKLRDGIASGLSQLIELTVLDYYDTDSTRKTVIWCSPAGCTLDFQLSPLTSVQFLERKVQNVSNSGLSSYCD